MRQADPPLMATWLLEHLTPGGRNDALAGDLLEEFRSGRSAFWYWRQVFAAIAISWLTETLHRRVLVIFAALWSMLAPAWRHYAFRIVTQGNLTGWMWRLAWPGSTICYFGLNLASHLAVDLSFIWAGMLLYLTVQVSITRNLSVQQFVWGLFRSVPGLISGFGLIFALGFLLPPDFPANQRSITVFGVITETRLLSLTAPLPYFMAIISGLWGVTLRTASANKKIVA